MSAKRQHESLVISRVYIPPSVEARRPGQEPLLSTSSYTSPSPEPYLSPPSGSSRKAMGCTHAHPRQVTTLEGFLQCVTPPCLTHALSRFQENPPPFYLAATSYAPSTRVCNRTWHMASARPKLSSGGLKHAPPEAISCYTHHPVPSAALFHLADRTTLHEPPFPQVHS